MFNEPDNLSPDLEWMLQSSQAGDEMIVELAAREHYEAVYNLALSLLGNPAEAGQAAQETLAAAPAYRHRYSSRLGVRNWLLRLTIQACRAHRRNLRLRQALAPARAAVRRFSRSARAGISRPVTVEERSAAGEAERQVWAAVDRLEDPLRIPLLLHHFHRLPQDDTAAICGTALPEVERRLSRARRRLHGQLRRRLCQLRVDEAPGRLGRLMAQLPPHSGIRRQLEAAPDERISAQPRAGLEKHLASCRRCRAYHVELAELEALLDRALRLRWSGMEAGGGEPERRVDSFERQLGIRRRQQNLLHRAQQGAAAGAILALILFAGWLTNRLFPRSAAGPQVRTVLVTRLVNVPGTPAAPGLDQPPEPLTRFSSPEEVLQRMQWSRKLWDSVWVDARIIQYGPPGYIGPPKTYRNQVWAEPSERRFTLAGPLNEAPSTLSISRDDRVYELTLADGQTYSYRTNQQEWEEIPVHGVNSSYLDGSYLARLLFPGELADQLWNLKVRGSEPRAGRTALSIQAVLEDGAPLRFWIDAQTGVVLGWNKYDRESQWLVAEDVSVTHIRYGADFPEESFSTYTRKWEEVTWKSFPEGSPEAAAETAPEDARSPTPTWAPPPGREPYSMGNPFQPTPGGSFSASRSRLTFQWASLYQPGDEPGEVAALFADGILLGEVRMGNPWNILCERSTDGLLIAFVQGWGEPFFPSSGLRWLSLNQAAQVHDPLPIPNSQVGNDFAFSPDSRYLAFWGCGGSETNCGVYLHNTQTRKNKKLLGLPNADYLAWSPDGQHLAMLTRNIERNTGKASDSLLVASTRYGEVIYRAPFDFENPSIPEDSPVHAWGIPYPPDKTDLSGCVEAPGR